MPRAASIAALALALGACAAAPPPDDGIAICSVANAEDSLVMLGRWSRQKNLLERPVRLAGSDLQQLLGLEQPLPERREHVLDFAAGVVGN